VHGIFPDAREIHYKSRGNFPITSNTKFLNSAERGQTIVKSDLEAVESGRPSASGCNKQTDEWLGQNVGPTITVLVDWRRRSNSTGKHHGNHSIYIRCHRYSSHGKPPTSGYPPTGLLRKITVATVPISLHALNICFLSYLLYVLVSDLFLLLLSPLLYRTQVDSDASINLIHNCFLVRSRCRATSRIASDSGPCQNSFFLFWLCLIIMYCGWFILFWFFFVPLLEAHSLTLGMPYLEQENPALDWTKKILTPHSLLRLPSHL